MYRNGGDKDMCQDYFQYVSSLRTNTALQQSLDEGVARMRMGLYLDLANTVTELTETARKNG